MNDVTSHSDAETLAMGSAFAADLRPGDVVALLGDLGTGKTRFVIGACRRLGANGPITSPTFTLVNEYAARDGKIVHIDLYRISSRPQLAELGLEEYFDGTAVCFVEWAEHILDMLPGKHYEVRLTHGAGPSERIISIRKTAPAAPGSGREEA